MEPISIKIHKTSNPNKSRLSLEGTVLIFEEKNKVLESEMQIPVELISISEGKRYRGKRLIIALLFPAASLLFLGLSFFFIKDVLGVPDDSIYEKVHLIVVFSIILLSMVAFFIYLVLFFIRVKTVAFFIAPDGYKIEFWKSKNDSKKIDELIEQINQRQAKVEAPFEHPVRNSVYTSKYSPVLRIIIIIFLFAIPALTTENLFLFLLVLLPVIWFVYKGIQYMNQPENYRKAMSFYIQKNWDSAISLLNCLKEDCPEYLPTYPLLVGIYLRTKQFDDALSMAASLPYDYNDLAQDIQTDVWYFKRLYERRKSTLT